MSAPQKSESPVAAGQIAEQNVDIAILPPAQKTGKSEATLIAKFALRGHAVHKGSNHDFNVCRWGMSRYCADFAELQAFAVQLGVNK